MVEIIRRVDEIFVEGGDETGIDKIRIGEHLEEGLGDRIPSLSCDNIRFCILDKNYRRKLLIS